MKINKKLIAKMIKRIETMPETYDQQDYARSHFEGEARPRPTCGTVCCLAGEAIICSERSVAKGVARLLRCSGTGVSVEATELIGLDRVRASRLFDTCKAATWPTPYRQQFQSAKTYKGEARAAVNLLKAILRTDGKILTETERR